jgi:hypothetical protein
MPEWLARKLKRGVQCGTGIAEKPGVPYRITP